jgi:hypothetical protein
MKLEPGVFETTFDDGVTALWELWESCEARLNTTTVICIDGTVRRRRAPFDAKHIGRRVRDPQIVVALPKGTRLMFTDGGNDKFTLGIDSLPRGFYDHVRAGRVIILDEPKAEAPKPRTFADVKVGQRWRYKLNDCSGEIIRITGVSDDGVNVFNETTGSASSRSSSWGEWPWEKRWEYIGDAEPEKVADEAPMPVAPGVIDEAFKRAAETYQGYRLVVTSRPPGGTSIYRPFSQRMSTPDPYEPNIAHAAIFAAMTTQNAEYQSRRLKELCALKQTFKQEAPLFRNAPMVRGRDW